MSSKNFVKADLCIWNLLRISILTILKWHINWWSDLFYSKFSLRVSKHYSSPCHLHCVYTLQLKRFLLMKLLFLTNTSSCFYRWKNYSFFSFTYWCVPLICVECLHKAFDNRAAQTQFLIKLTFSFSDLM